MAKQFILCSSCGVKNRLGKGKGQAKCGKCGKLLFVDVVIDVIDNSASSIFFAVVKRFWWVGAFVFLIFILSQPVRTSDNYAGAKNYQGRETEKPVFNEPPVSVSHGTILEKNHTLGVAPLEIRTSSGENYFVKVVYPGTIQPILAAYIEGGKPFEVELPIGSYEIHYASGRVWYGQKYLFGPETVYSKADTVFNFSFDGGQYLGNTIELILQTNGNLSTTQISPEKF